MLKKSSFGGDLMSTKITIIGGGIAGLTTAFRLKRAGMKVVLLEKSNRVGGAMHTIEEFGFQSELGPNTVLETSPKVTELIEDSGLVDDKIYADDSSQNRYIVRNKKPMPLAMSPRAFIGSPLFSWKAKIRLLGELFIPAWDNRYEENLSQFVIRRLGKEFLDYAINPFVAGVYAGDPDKLSVKHGFPRLYELEQKYGGMFKGQIKGARERKKRGEIPKQSARMFSFKNGLKMLPERLGELLGEGLIKNATVTQISKTEKNWKVVYNDKNQKAYDITSDAILYAGRACDLNNLKLGSNVPQEFEDLAGIYHPPVSVISMGFKRSSIEDPLNGFGVLIPKVENFNILGVLYSSTLFPKRAPKDHVLLTIFAGGSRQPEVALKDKTELKEVAIADIRTILGVRDNPVYTNIVRWNKAIPQYQVGYGKYKKIISELEKHNPGLFFTGNYRNGISVADTIVNATESAESITAYFKEELPC